MPWCIVPFDASKRSPEERTKMLVRLGLKRSAYDWRAQHVPEFEEEILQYQKHGIEFFAFWNAHENRPSSSFKSTRSIPKFGKPSFKSDTSPNLENPQIRHPGRKDRHCQGSHVSAGQADRRDRMQVRSLQPWRLGRKPENLVAVCKALRAEGHEHVGIVYNWHHGHDRIQEWKDDLNLMKPFLLCLNLNGMNTGAKPKILALGKGEHEERMLKILIESGYEGPIGILDHQNHLDAEESLRANLDGLKKFLFEYR